MLGAADFRAYELFNYFECGAWFAIAVGLHLRFRKHPADKRAVIARTCIALVVFGVSDYFEAPMHARLTWWLWGWKILCGAYLLKCRQDYLGWERFRWFDPANILAFCMLLTIAVVIFLQHHSRDLLDNAR
jgi:hypothetical protein